MIRVLYRICNFVNCYSHIIIDIVAKIIAII